MSDLGEDEEFSLEDLRSLRKVFFFLFVFLSFVVIGTTIWLGYHNWRWYIAIPISGICMLAIRIFNRMLRNSLDEEEESALQREEDADKLGSIGFAFPKKEETEEEIEIRQIGFAIPGADSRHNIAQTIEDTEEGGLNWWQTCLIGIVFVIFAPAFWYGLGVIASLGLN